MSQCILAFSKVEKTNNGEPSVVVWVNSSDETNVQLIKATAIITNRLLTVDSKITVATTLSSSRAFYSNLIPLLIDLSVRSSAPLTIRKYLVPVFSNFIVSLLIYLVFLSLSFSWLLGTPLVV